MLSSGPTTPYDDVLYPGRVYGSTHPNRLATMATLYGMRPTPVERCRVLELGCGFGGNLTPMAFQYPDSEFVGVDLSGSTIAQGQRDVAAFGLTNVKLVHTDIMDVDSSFGQFDYIISHGVYSWVPSAVRERMMEIFKNHLTPHGVCYVSYNALPFSHMRNLARDMMLFHTRDLPDMNQKVSQARAIMQFLSDATNADTVYGAVMREQNDRIVKMPDEVLFHDDLSEIAEPFLLHQVVDHAGRRGLQYLCDAEFFRRNLSRYSEAVRAVLQQFPDNEFMLRDQYHDFVDGCGFRRTLLCHSGIALQRQVGIDFVRRFYLLSSTAPVDESFCLTDASDMEFRTYDGSTLRVSHPVLKAAHLCLGRAWPRSFTFDELLGEASRLLESTVRPDSEEARILTESIYVMAFNGEVTFQVSRVGLTATIDDRPLVARLARKQSESDTVVTNLLHQSVRLEDEQACRILQLLDGTRTFDELVVEICRPGFVAATIPEQGSQALDPVAVSANLQRFLKTASKLGLLFR